MKNYWKIEAFNALFLPGVATYWVLRSGDKITPAFALSACACLFLLVIGTIALRMMLGKAEGDAKAANRVVPLLIFLRWPAMGLCVAAAIAVGLDWAFQGIHLSPNRISSLLLLLLALLEYINYYHFQVQHFDHAADWNRLLTGRGFRRSHLAREIERWKLDRNRRVTTAPPSRSGIRSGGGK